MMMRYAVKVTDVKGEVCYESIGKGLSPDKQDAHLYTRIDLAEAKQKQYKKMKQWYKEATIIPVNVEWPEDQNEH